MFRFFSRVSNAQIEAAARAALERYEINGDLRRAVDTLTAFAEQNRLGSFKRARIATEVAGFFIEGGVSDRAAAGYGKAFALFVAGEVQARDVHWRAFEAGLEGAIRHLSGWEQQGTSAADAAIAREYVGSPRSRDAIRISYLLGWSICGDGDLAREQLERLERDATAPVPLTPRPRTSPPGRSGSNRG